MRTPTTVRGKVVAVTGGARGIGYAIAEHLAAAGARVVLGDLDADAAQDAAARIGRGVVGAALDVTDDVSYAAFLDLVAVEAGPLDVLVSNAGVMWVGSFLDEPMAAVRRQVEVNFLGVVRGVRLAVPRMAGRGGTLVTVASAASWVAPPGEATYAATKHAVLGWLSAVRGELRGSGVEVCAVLPGVVETELAAGTSAGPVRRLQPEEIARAVVDVVARPRFETVIPARISLLRKVSVVLPAPARDLMHRLLLPDQVAAARATDVRSRYQSRHFTPGSPQ